MAKLQNGEVTKWQNYRTANVTERRMLQNGECYKTANVTKRQMLQNGYYYKMAIITKKMKKICI